MHVITALGPMKGVLPTCDTGPFFPSDTDIQTEINFGRHQHSELSTRHSTPHLSLTLDTLISKSTLDITQYFESTSDTQTPFMGPSSCYLHPRDVDSKSCNNMHKNLLQRLHQFRTHVYITRSRLHALCDGNPVTLSFF